jgi:3-oxoacyl-[acyl-carrier-protein] synthase-1
MEMALAQAGVSRDAVDYVNAHATGTGAGDLSEIKAIRRVFNGACVPFVSSTKALTGHGLCLAGAMEAAFTALALQNKFIPVSAKIRQLDPACRGVPVLIQAVEKEPEVALSNSSGFGGANVSLVLRRWEIPDSRDVPGA